MFKEPCIFFAKRKANCVLKEQNFFRELFVEQSASKWHGNHSYIVNMVNYSTIIKRSAKFIGLMFLSIGNFVVG